MLSREPAPVCSQQAMLLFPSLGLQEVVWLLLMEYLPRVCCCPGGCDEVPHRRKHSGRGSEEAFAPVTGSMYPETAPQLTPLVHRRLSWDRVSTVVKTKAEDSKDGSMGEEFDVHP